MLRFEEHIAPYLVAYNSGKAKLPDKKHLHKYYHQSVAHKKLLAEVFGDEYPEFLQVDRPKEKDKPSHRTYRKAIFKNIVTPFRRRVTNAIAAIRNADDWVVEFPSADEAMPYEDTLRFYLTEDFGAWKSLEQWFWKQGVQRYIDDPNACGLLLPTPPEVQSQYTEVTPIWATCEQVWYFEEGRRAVIRAEQTSTVTMRDGKTADDGLVLYFFDRESYAIAKQVAVDSQGKTQWEITGLQDAYNDKGELVGVVENFPRHYCRVMPCFRLGSQMRSASEDGRFVLYESLVSVAVPNLKAVLQRASDIDIEALLHTGSEEWRYLSRKCGTCQGRGSITEWNETTERQEPRKCSSCGGEGYAIPSSNLEKWILTPPTEDSFNDDTKAVSLPTPPGGIIERSADAIKEFREEYIRNFTEAYQAVGLGHVATALFMATSGTSKRYDRAEFEALQVDTAKHFAKELLGPLYTAADAIRYGPAGKAGQQVPTIKSPRRFDISTADITREELNDAMKNNYSEELKDALQLKFIKQTAGEDSHPYKAYRVKMMLDPYRNMDSESKEFAKSALMVNADRKSPEFTERMRALDFSLAFDQLIKNATLADPEFYDKKLDEQNKLLETEHAKYFSVKPAIEPIENATLAPTINVKDVNQNIGA